MLRGNEELYTLVNEQGHPVYTNTGMDGHFSVCESFGDMMTFTKKIGWSQMMQLAKWSQTCVGEGRIKVFPAKVTFGIEKIPVE